MMWITREKVNEDPRPNIGGCSGLAYAGVIHRVPVWVSGSAVGSRTLAIPKSSSFTCRVRPKKMGPSAWGYRPI